MLAPLFGWLDQTSIQSLDRTGFRTDSSRSNLRNQNICSCPTILTSKAIPILYVSPVRTGCPAHIIHSYSSFMPQIRMHTCQVFPKSNGSYTVILQIHTNTIYYMNMHTMLYAPTRGISSKTPFIFIFTPTKRWEGTPKWIAPSFTSLELEAHCLNVFRLLPAVLILPVENIAAIYEHALATNTARLRGISCKWQ